MRRTIRCTDARTGLRAFIAIDDTTLGPGLGGVRFKPYPDAAAAAAEAGRLAAAMTCKNAVAELPYGGAKAVIVKHDEIHDRTALMRSFGECVAATDGGYLPGVDMGTGPSDLAAIAAAGCPVSCASADPSPWTARGVGAAIRAAAWHELGRGPDGLSVAIQGTGHVGAALAADLVAAGADVVLADLDRDRAEAVAAATGARTVAPELIATADCDVFAPCAAAAVLNEATISALRCRIVAGAANATLAAPSDADRLARAGIVYVPDYVANAGGVIHIHALRSGWTEAELAAAVDRIGDRVEAVLGEAEAGGQTPLAVAARLAADRIAAARTAPAVAV